jgi:hypothetical protein
MLSIALRPCIGNGGLNSRKGNLAMRSRCRLILVWACCCAGMVQGVRDGSRVTGIGQLRLRGGGGVSFVQCERLLARDENESSLDRQRRATDTKLTLQGEWTGGTCTGARIVRN